MARLLLAVPFLSVGRALGAQDPAPPAPATQQPPAPAAAPARDSVPTARPPVPWFERIQLRGYTQVRYNQLFATNPDLQCPQCDRSIGSGGGFFMRRLRLVFSGELSERVSFYIQPDFASDAGNVLHFGQIRDAYFDVALDRARTYRIRVGQSKMPFGFENLQSSSNRIPLDRADALNSALPNERDLGVLAYWAPRHVRQRLKVLVDSGLKGSGDYGAFGVGVFNGQGANRPDANDAPHVVARLSWPFLLAGGQFLELGVQGYGGRFVIPSSGRSARLVGPSELVDRRVAATFVLYPQPFGLQAEWNVGRGPEVDPATRTVAERPLDGGYVLASFRHRARGQTVIPFVRVQRYDGGKKFELDARSYRVREMEIGAEWLPQAPLELTAMYTISDRRYEDVATPVNRQRGRLLRLQAQFNY